MINKYTLVLSLFLLMALVSVPAIAATGGTSKSPSDSEVPDGPPPIVDDPPSDAELQDLKAVASQFGISVQDAIDRYAWNDNFG